jgi:hypothetical protein
MANFMDAIVSTMNADSLKNLAQTAGLAKIPSRKADVATALANMIEGDGLEAVWNRLDDVQKAATSEVVHSHSSVFDEMRFVAKYGSSPVWSSDGRGGYGYSSRRPSLLGLFLLESNRERVMPDDVKKRLAEFIPQPRTTQVATVDEPPALYAESASTDTVDVVIRNTERDALRELAAVLRLVDAGKVAVSDKTSRPSGAAIKAIAAVLSAGDYYADTDEASAGAIKAFAWPMLIQAGGLAKLDGKRLVLTNAGRRALSAEPSEVLVGLWQKWESTKLLDELSRIDIIKGQTGKGARGLVALATRRGSISETLAACPPQRWMSIDDFIRYIRATGHSTTITRNEWALYVDSMEYGSLGYDDNITIAEDRYVLAVLLEYVATLGLIDVAIVPPADARHDYGDIAGADYEDFFSRYDGLLYVRVNALGAYCFGTASTYEAMVIEEAPAVNVLPNLDIVATGETLGHDDRLALDSYAVPMSDRTWRLDGERLLGFVEHGGSVDEVRTFLRARSATLLPDTALRFLDDIEGRVGKFRLTGMAQLVQCGDAVLAALIANDPTLERIAC